MNNKYECSVEDLFELFSENLEPADVLSAKLMAQISTSITRERIKLHMGQKEFAKHINASQSLVSRWEHGDYNFSIKKLADIASRLDLDVNIAIHQKITRASYSSGSYILVRTSYNKTSAKKQQTYSVSQYYQEVKKYATVCQ